MKRWLLLPTLLSVVAHAADVSDLIWVSDGSQVTITGCQPESTGPIDIPSLINGLPVTAIGDTAFSFQSYLTSVTIPNSVNTIGDHAFYACTSLASANIPSSVTSIGIFSFSDCISLTSISIPDGVTTIPFGLFSGCSGLTSISLPETLTSIEGTAFSYCSEADTITIPENVQSIGKDAFVGCSDLTSATIPANVTFVGPGAFAWCPSLSSIEVDPANSAYSSVAGVLFDKTISTIFSLPGSYSGSYLIPGSVTFIADSAFAGCTGLTSINLPEGIAVIGPSAFEGCSGMVSVSIPSSVSHIGDSAFTYCGALSSVTIPDGVMSIGDYAFANCWSLTSVSIGDSVTLIADGAFSECVNLTRISLGSSVSSIGNEVFSYCVALSSVLFSGPPPSSVGTAAFLTYSPDPIALVLPEQVASFGGVGATWNDLIVEIQPPAITACGFADADTFFVEISPAAPGYKVTFTPNLDFSTATEVTPTMQPSSIGENRFEFELTGTAGFFRVETP